jgi:type II secretory pathway pseudopilin PulG
MTSTERHKYHIWTQSGRHYTNGSALIALIAAILIFSVLAAALLPMVSSSGEQAVLSNLGDKAYLLSEAGYRLAKNHYENPPAGTTRNAALEALDNDQDGNFTLSNNQGRFSLGIFSYYLSIPSGAYIAGNQITANPPGRLPINSALHDDDVTIPGGQLLSIDGTIYAIASSATPTAADENVSFSLVQPGSDPPLPQPLDIPNETNAYPAARANQTSLVIGQDLRYQSGHGAMFPLRNGRIRVQGYSNPLSYRYNNRAQNMFEEVRDPIDTTITNINSFPADALIVLNQTVRVRSTGMVGGGGSETRRAVNYYLAGGSEQNEEVPIALDDFQATDDNATVTDIAGNQALAITEATNSASLLQLSSTVGAAPLRRASSRGGGYLSYDAQVKVGFQSGSLPLAEDPIGIIPSSVTPVAAGLTFRLNRVDSDTDFNGYGLSFMRADDTSLPADIFSSIVPAGMNDQHLMVLWQQTGAGATWLAYKNLQLSRYPTPPAEFDDVLAAWSRNNSSWQLDNTIGRYISPAWNYVYNDRNATAELRSPLIVLDNPDPSSSMWAGAPSITLTFWCQEIRRLSESPYRRAFISYNSGPFSRFYPIREREESGWYLYSYDLSPHYGQTIQLRLTVDQSSIVQWVIDDVRVSYQWPVQDSTLLVRLREAAVVGFSQGGPGEIRQGDWVSGATSGTRGRVLQPPLVTSGDWSAGSPAAGTLLLDNLSANPSGFTIGENLMVVGRTGGITARVDAFDNVTGRKVNIIKTYYARATGIDSGNTDPLDPVAHTYPRRVENDPFRWPPDEDENWTAPEDYFRLVQWDEINDENVPNLGALSYIDDDNRTVENAVLRSYDPDLQSPPLGQPVSTELGLHAYGEGADNVYFDDFGLRLFLGTSSLFDTVLQQ